MKMLPVGDVRYINDSRINFLLIVELFEDELGHGVTSSLIADEQTRRIFSFNSTVQGNGWSKRNMKELLGLECS